MEDRHRAQHERAEIQTANDVFDPSSAAQRLGGEKLLRKIIVLFLKNVPNTLEEIDDSIAQTHGTRLERSAHALASSLAYLSAKLASDAALALEQMGRNGDFSRATSTCERLHSEVERLESALSAFVSKENVPRES